jgi:hypothetical protein
MPLLQIGTGMSALRKLFGALLIVAGFGAIIYGLYLDISYFFVGGILEAIHGFKADPTADGQIIWGSVKVLLFGVGFSAGVVIAMICWVSGAVLMGMESRRSRRRCLSRY